MVRFIKLFSLYVEAKKEEKERGKWKKRKGERILKRFSNTSGNRQSHTWPFTQYTFTS